VEEVRFKLITGLQRKAYPFLAIPIISRNFKFERMPKVQGTCMRTRVQSELPNALGQEPY
jgi:hypothetical protein